MLCSRARTWQRADFDADRRSICHSPPIFRQRFPAITWSGDRQDCSHDMIMQFTLYGQLYTACDMTSPDATVLVRQYQNAVFMPIMRVHQVGTMKNPNKSQRIHAPIFVLGPSRRPPPTHTSTRPHALRAPQATACH